VQVQEKNRGTSSFSQICRSNPVKDEKMKKIILGYTLLSSVLIGAALVYRGQVKILPWSSPSPLFLANHKIWTPDELNRRVASPGGIGDFSRFPELLADPSESSTALQMLQNWIATKVSVNPMGKTTLIQLPLFLLSGVELPSVSVCQRFAEMEFIFIPEGIAIVGESITLGFEAPCLESGSFLGPYSLDWEDFRFDLVTQLNQQAELQQSGALEGTLQSVSSDRSLRLSRGGLALEGQLPAAIALIQIIFKGYDSRLVINLPRPVVLEIP
jgi:hypothetical protein